MFTLFLILQIIPMLIFAIAGICMPYNNLKKGDTILTYIDNIQITPFILAWCAFITPILNWIAVIAILTEEKNFWSGLWEYICNFFSELLLALKLLIVWMFGLKYICRFLKKILSVSIK